jgi:DNA-binding MarR family transcriptional regulator
MKNRALPAPTQYDRRRRTFYRLSMVSVQLTRCISALYVRKFGRPANGWRILAVIGRYAPVCASDVADLTVLESDKIARILAHLAERGLVQRRQEKKDRRRVMLSLTAKGVCAYEWLEEVRDRMDEKMFLSLTAAEQKSLGNIVEKLEMRTKIVFQGKAPWEQFCW